MASLALTALMPFKRECYRYLGFSELTLIPLQRKLIDISALSASEVAWIDAYHARIWEEISPRLTDDQEATAWLKAATEPLKVPSLVTSA